MSSFFDSLNFNNNHASSSSSSSLQRLDSAPVRSSSSSSPRKRRSIYRPLSSRTSSLSPIKKGGNQNSVPRPPSQPFAHNDDNNDSNEGIQVYWNCPPSSLMGDWGKSMVESAKAKRLNGAAQTMTEEDDSQSATIDHDAMASRWTRQDSRASDASSASVATSTSTSTASTASTTRRTTKALRRIKKQQQPPSSPFRRHASSHAALGSIEAAKKDVKGTGVISGGMHMQQLLADLSIRVQEIDRQVQVDDDEDGDDDQEADVTIGESKSTNGTSRRIKSGTAGSPATPLSSGTVTVTSTGHSASSQQRASAHWERSVTFPPTGSPAVGTSRASTVDDNDNDAEDSFGDDFDFDEEFLRDIELSQQLQQQGSEMPLGSVVPPQEDATTASLLGKRRCPPSPAGKESFQAGVEACSGSISPPPLSSAAAPSASARSVSVGRFVDDDEGEEEVSSAVDRSNSRTGPDSSWRSRSHSPLKASSTSTRATATTSSRLGTRANSGMSTAAYPSTYTSKAIHHRTAAAARTRSAGLPRQQPPPQQHRRPPLSANIQNNNKTTQRTHTHRTSSSAFKPPSRAVVHQQQQPRDVDESEFDAMLDDSELDRALTAAGY